MPEPSEAGDHLVGGEQDLVLVAERAHALPVARGRDERAAGVLHRLHVHHADRLRPHRDDRLLEVVEQEPRELLLGLALRPVVAVRVVHVPHLGDERLERIAERRDAVDRERAERRAVIREVPRDRLVAARRPAHLGDDRVVAGLGLVAADRDGDRLEARLVTRDVVLARELPGRLDGLGAAGDEEDAVQVAGRERRELRGELDRARVRVRPVRVERQLAHLLERRLADLLAEAVAEVDREEAGERVEVAVALAVLEIAAVAAHDDRRLVTAHPREVEPEMVARRALELLGVVRCLERRHAAPPFGVRAPQS